MGLITPRELLRVLMRPLQGSLDPPEPRSTRQRNVGMGEEEEEVDGQSRRIEKTVRHHPADE